MINHYEILGINSSATADEVRRAYRILARRYHPDLNPGKGTEDKFKQIAASYGILIDAEGRRLFDIELQAFQSKNTKASSAAADAHARARRARAWKNAQDSAARAKEHQRGEGAFWRSGAFRMPPTSPTDRAGKESSAALNPLDRAKDLVSKLLGGMKGRGQFSVSEAPRKDSARVTIIEASVSFKDAVLGTKKTVEIQEPEGPRKVSVKIPPGVRNGSVIRLRSRDGNEELILIVRLAYHPFLQMHPKGLIVEVPITVSEAIVGASISVPTLDEPVMVRIPPGTQSGAEIRLRERGIAQKDGTKGDLFVRVMIYIPDSPDAHGLKDKGAELEKYYANSVRARLPRSLLDNG